MTPDPDPGWQSLRHRESREWASEALGDPRQVYARDSEASAGDSLVYLGEGKAEQFRSAAKSRRLVCPVSGL
jgi:hypothetical protein